MIVIANCPKEIALSCSSDKCLDCLKNVKGESDQQIIGMYTNYKECKHEKENRCR